MSHSGHNYLDLELTYELGGFLAEGGFGKVFTGYRRSDGFPVAIKFILASKVSRWKEMEDHLIPLEIYLLKACQNASGVILLLDWFKKEEDEFAIVMERPLKSIDLFTFINHKKFIDENLARDFFKQIVSTIKSCFNEGVMYRDIKDQNILIDIENMKLKLIDFGGATFVCPNHYNDYYGTPCYAPPEYIMKKGYDGIQATVWSLGILLYVMVTGELPFKNDLEILGGIIAWPRILSSGCKQLIYDCLSIEVSRRPSFDMLLNHPWILFGETPTHGILIPGSF